MTDSVAHLGPVECEEPPLPCSLFQRRTDCCGLGLGCRSQTLLQILSVSLCCPPWLREAGQQSRFLCVFLHWWKQRLPTHISTAAPEGSWLPFHYCKPNSLFWEGYVLCEPVFAWLDNRLLSKETNSDRWSTVLQNILQSRTIAFCYRSLYFETLQRCNHAINLLYSKGKSDILYVKWVAVHTVKTKTKKAPT